LPISAQTLSTANLRKPFQNWLEEDVAYIITPEERSEYLGFATDQQRLEFIQQFWLKRDPTPGTDENEFKEEHYRRLAYSNVHFADSRAGWKTDRGRIYIVNGPPERIEVARSNATTGLIHPSEDWRYKHGKQFRFVDNCDCGEYELQVPSMDLRFKSQMN
jgi:GWxTD domain-containing protein